MLVSSNDRRRRESSPQLWAVGAPESLRQVRSRIPDEFDVSEFRNLQAIGARSIESAPALILIALDWPDHYAADEVLSLYATFPTSRVLACVSPWCASIGRSRGLWPVTAVVSSHELTSRLRFEWCILNGSAEPIPVTGQREDVVRARFEEPSPLLNGTEPTVAIFSTNASLRSWLMDALSRCGIRTSRPDESGDCQIAIIDGDPWTEHSRRVVEQAMAGDSAVKAVVLTDVIDPGAHPLTHDRLRVVSKFASPHSWIRELLTMTGLLIAAALPGCAGESRSTSGEVAPSAESWTAQVAAVRDGNSRRIVVSSAITREEWLELQEGCESVEVIEVEKPEIVDSDLEILAGLKQLRRLAIGAAIGDRGAELIARCPTLTELNLPRSRVTDAGVKSLATLPLTQLRMGSPLMTNAGLAELRSIPQLKFLHLIGAPIGDAGLKSIVEMRSLQSFYLDGSQCTDEGLSAMMHSRPDLHFHRDQLHLPDDPNADAH
jgi:hypothetical protein